jgi:hypothetical protein
MTASHRRYFVLIKRGGCARDGTQLSAKQAALQLLAAGTWALWSLDDRRRRVVADDQVAIYIAGEGEDSQHVIATARVAGTDFWSTDLDRSYPLIPSGVSGKVLRLDHVKLLEPAVDVRHERARLQATTRDPSKWGLAFRGGIRVVSSQDFAVLSGASRRAAAAAGKQPGGRHGLQG